MTNRYPLIEDYLEGEYVEPVDVPFKPFEQEFPNEDIMDVFIMKDEPDFKLGKPTIINLNNPKLFAAQEKIDLAKIKQKDFPSNIEHLPVVIGLNDGRKIIQDGHHRLAKLKLAGELKAKVILIPNTVYSSLEEIKNYIALVVRKVLKENWLK